MVEAEGFELKLYRFGKTLAYGIDSEQQEAIRQLPLLQAAAAPEEYVSPSQFADMHEVSQTTIIKWINELGIELSTYRNKGGRPGPMLSPSQQSQLAELPFISRKAPEGYVSVSAMSKRLGMKRLKLMNIIDELGIELSEYFFSTHLAAGLSSKQQEAILKHIR
jgi:hypothetical protein